MKTSLDTTPGVGYVLTEGNTTVQRVRAFHVTDSDIAWLTAHFAPPARRDSALAFTTASNLKSVESQA